VVSTADNGTLQVAPPHDSPIIAAILPPDVVAMEALGELPDARLLPDEEGVVVRAVEKRRREFATGRQLARRALAALGYPALPIVPGPHREPVWPEGVVGSITHCKDYCAAVVGRSERIVAIGIDAEPDAPLPDGVLRMVSVDEEREWIHAHAGKGPCWDRLLFSAKESVFKAWYPLMHRWLDFGAVTVRFDPDGGSFHASFVNERPVVDNRALSGFDGRYLVYGAMLLTSVSLARQNP
jgi:4'-phosphopantetheinyl transferase EntD